MNKKIFKLILLLMLSFTFITLTAYDCPENSSKPDDKMNQQNNGGRPVSGDGGNPEITYPNEAMTIQVYNGGSARLSVEVRNVAGSSIYRWEKYENGSWLLVGSGGDKKQHLIEKVSKENDGDQYRCVTHYKGWDELTSPTFTIKVIEKTDSENSTETSTEEQEAHVHNWEPEYKTETTYQEVKVYGYKCNGCNFTTREKEKMEKHDAANQPVESHGGYQSNVVIDTKTMPVYGYACNGCDFTTQDEAAMNAHNAANQSVESHGGYESNVVISYYNCPDVTVYICNNCNTQLAYSDIAAHMADYHPAHTVSGGYQCTKCSVVFASYEAWEEHTTDCRDSDCVQIDWACNCGDTFADETSAKAHETPGGSWRTETQSGGVSPIYGYKCNGCGFTTGSEAEIKAHEEANQRKEGHGGYRSNVQIGSKDTEIIGYACNGCDFTTRSYNAMKKHQEANQGKEGHGGYQGDVHIDTVRQVASTRQVPSGYMVCSVCSARQEIEEDTTSNPEQ